MQSWRREFEQRLGDVFEPLGAFLMLRETLWIFAAADGCDPEGYPGAHHRDEHGVWRVFKDTDESGAPLDEFGPSRESRIQLVDVDDQAAQSLEAYWKLIARVWCAFDELQPYIHAPQPGSPAHMARLPQSVWGEMGVRGLWDRSATPGGLYFPRGNVERFAGALAPTPTKCASGRPVGRKTRGGLREAIRKILKRRPDMTWADGGWQALNDMGWRDDGEHLVSPSGGTKVKWESAEKAWSDERGKLHHAA